MRKFALLAVPALVAALTLAACGGGGSSTKTFKGPNGQTVKLQTGDKPPSDFPSDFPVYGGAKYQGGVSTTEQGVSGFYAAWTTGDSVDKVLSYYTDQFKNGDWTTTATVNSGSEGTFISVEKKSDPSMMGFVTIAATGGETDIGIIVGKNPAATEDNSDSGKETPTAASSDGGSSTDTGSAALPDEVSLSSDFPTDKVPLPSGIRITQSSAITSGAEKIQQVQFYTKDSADDVVSYFKDNLPKSGTWAQALSTSSGDTQFLTFAGENNSGVTVQVQKSDVAGYQVVTVLVTLSGS